MPPTHLSFPFHSTLYDTTPQSAKVIVQEGVEDAAGFGILACPDYPLGSDAHESSPLPEQGPPRDRFCVEVLDWSFRTKEGGHPSEKGDMEAWSSSGFLRR